MQCNARAGLMQADSLLKLWSVAGEMNNPFSLGHLSNLAMGAWQLHSARHQAVRLFCLGRRMCMPGACMAIADSQEADFHVTGAREAEGMQTWVESAVDGDGERAGHAEMRLVSRYAVMHVSSIAGRGWSDRHGRLRKSVSACKCECMQIPKRSC